jgi:hypothetical protein
MNRRLMELNVTGRLGGRSFACLETYKMLKLIRTISQDHRIDCPGLGETRQLGFDAIFVYM